MVQRYSHGDMEGSKIKLLFNRSEVYKLYYIFIPMGGFAMKKVFGLLGALCGLTLASCEGFVERVPRDGW